MSDSNTPDPAMLELFNAELDTHVPVLSQGILAIEKGLAGEKEFEAMMRAAHSIKGAARIVGIEAAVRVAHVLEDCFSAAQASRIALGSDAVDVLLQGVDGLQRICTPQSEPTMSEQSIQALLERICAIRDGQSQIPSAAQGKETLVTPVAVHMAPRSAPSAEHRVVWPSVMDASAAESLRIELSNALIREPPRVLLDFGNARCLSASALSLLASFARASSATIGAEGVSAEMSVLLQVTGLDRTIKPRE